MIDYIPAWVDSYIGVPFAEYNCYNLMRKVYAEQLGTDLPDLDDEYLHSFDTRSIARLYLREMKQNWEKISKPKFGCLAAFRVKGVLWHCGMIVSKESMLHTQHALINSCLEPFDNITWNNKFVGFYNHVG